MSSLICAPHHHLREAPREQSGAMPTRCSVSRSVAEAALDPEFPGPPLFHYVQTKLKLVPKPTPKTSYQRMFMNLRD